MFLIFEEEMRMKKKIITAGIFSLLFLLVSVLVIVSLSKEYAAYQKRKLKEISGDVVVLGDSIWGLDKGKTGIGGYLEEITSLQVANFCIPGSSATFVEGAAQAKDSMVALLIHNQDKRSEEIRSKIREAEYVFLAHGANDYFQGVLASGEGNSFENSLYTSVAAIKEMNPNARIVLISPAECYLIPLDVLATENDFGGGTLREYTKAVKRVAEEEQLLCIDMLKAWNLTRENATQYLVDGAHLTKYAREKYSEYLLRRIYEYYY